MSCRSLMFDYFIEVFAWCSYSWCLLFISCILERFESSSSLYFMNNSALLFILSALICCIYYIISCYLIDYFILLLAASSSFYSLFSLAFIRICWCSIIRRAYFAELIFFYGAESSTLVSTFDATPFHRAVKLSFESNSRTCDAVFLMVLSADVAYFDSKTGDCIYFI